MSKLDPKPTIQNPLFGWERLNNELQSAFKLADKSRKTQTAIDSSKYSMSVEEIISEAERQGYKVTHKPNSVPYDLWFE